MALKRTTATATATAMAPGGASVRSDFGISVLRPNSLFSGTAAHSLLHSATHAPFLLGHATMAADDPTHP